ncbi:TetR/AcrR family transcriptional regulator [Curtobacterium ammoniigenes]|uniref:TetR/AcrR family transcriptional regulator n=1 Tax=Curtobacterium ammoniigenes TaxID=395387 RepID=UPI000830E96B|nr:TetR/AcrR family transcriptional regulator [Curtobacterium ammoniigenes]
MSELGLRDRKRAQTRSRIADAARTLALEAGIEHTTVEQIAQQADISPRTFFNYFATKEDAVLGIGETDLTQERIDEQLRAVGDRPTVEAVVGLIFGVFGETFADAELRAARKEILHRFPQLMRRQMSHMGAVAETLTAAVRTILERDPAWGPDGATPAAASMLLGMCMTALRTLAGPETKRPSVAPAVLEREVVALVQSTAERLVAATTAGPVVSTARRAGTSS